MLAKSPPNHTINDHLFHAGTSTAYVYRTVYSGITCR